MNAIILEDTTLRDGEQSPGVAFSKERKIAIFSSLIEAGIKWIEVGIPAMGGDELDTIETLLERKNEGMLVAWNRGVKNDVIQSLKLGFDAIHIGLPTSNNHLGDNLKKDRTWLLKTASELIKLAKDSGVFVSVSAEDVGRSELSFVEEYAAHVAESGADRIRLSDTVGILTPERYGAIVGRVKRASGIAVQCHAHNDFGLATANTLAGIQAGATFFHATVNGIGERAGMPDLAQCVLALKILYNIDLGVDETKLISLSQVVAQATRVKCYPWQPIIGENVFAHESGIHADGILKNNTSFEPFLPELVGGVRRIVIGKHSGRAALKYVLQSLGVMFTDSELIECLRLTRALSIKIERGLRDEELLGVVAAVRQGSCFNK
ncbi:hypothetical protein [Pseudomonas fluorescens]|uniref:Homocitrate synthase n=1 Tax=Pseudomonas fluorescens TaxID=294 RepID=A0A5E7DLB5_PSEFL|nr:hypothetical protein [Pseudomonas fluorescens]VVO18359.1 2-isopropylmalate synthase [Pseudomonas fluorescens]VVQ22108.1 2-isopropylmalate synthase [Pseudomonas fluorescens]